MRFGLVLAGVTIVTLVLIFGFYKIFLERAPIAATKTPPPTIQNDKQTLIANSSQIPASSAAIPLSPAPSAQPGSVERITPKPSATSSINTIGTLTVLQDNTTSTYSSTSGSSNISGTISFSGTAPTGSSVVIVARKNGTSDSYKTVVGGITPASGTSWTWSSAVAGTAYDMIAILKGAGSNGIDTDYAMSQTYIVNAPAYSQLFSLNAATAPSQPSGEITTTCSNKSGNSWNVTVTFPSVAGVQWYKLQVGSSSGASDIMDTTQAASSMSPSSTASFTDSVLYYAQFAVANTGNPTDYQYSEFSEPQTIKCP